MILERIEIDWLGPKLASVLERSRSTLSRSKAAYSAETLADLDVFVSTAHALLFTEPDATPASVFGNDDVVQGLHATLAGAEPPGLVARELFGRSRMVDASQWVPRGHYSPDGYAAYQRQFQVRDRSIGLDRYFRAMMFLSRFELNLVSRPCPSSQPGEHCVPEKTPREARLALALAELLGRAGVLGDLAEIEQVYAAFGGAREDVSIPELLRLARTAGTSSRAPNAPDALEKAIGNGHQRTARIHFMPQGATALPAITTVIGARITPDIAPLTKLVHDELPDRFRLRAADVGYVLGHDRAKHYLRDELAAHAGLDKALDVARAEIATTLGGKKDLFSSWLRAVARLAEPIDGVAPSFTRREAYSDLRLGSALVGYGQIRHNYVLMAGQGYDAYGCEIPDGYVEPALGTYDALIDYVRSARTLTAKSKPTLRRYFDRVHAVLSMLRSIVITQRSGAVLSDAQKRWLGMVAEYTPVGGYADSGAPPKYTGWYFDLFPDREIGAQATGEFVADYFTLTTVDEVRYLGAERPRLGVFVVDVGGEPRAMVGPVAKGYELTTPIGKRLDDAAARSAPGKTAAWQSYLAPDVPEPPMSVERFTCTERAQQRIVVQSPRALGSVSVTLLDHHGDALTTVVTRTLGPAPEIFAFELPPDLFERGVEGLHVHVHDLAPAGIGRGRFDFRAGPGVYTTEATRFDRTFSQPSFWLGGLEAPKPN